MELIGASAIAVPSDVVRSRLIAQYQLPPQKVKFIYNGVNTERFFPQDQKICRNKCGLPEKAFVIGFVGLAFTWYDLMTPLRALSALLPQWPGLTLVIVGDGPTRQPVHNLATELGVTNHLRWIGFQPHESIPDWINSFDVCLVPATRHCVEQYGILTTKFWEYSGCARTSIVSSLPDVPYPPELRGLMLEVIPEDLESYKEALALCRNKPEIIQDIAQNVYRFTLEHCTWRATAKETASLMEQVTTERRPPYVGQQRTSPHSRTPY